jgi:lipopolysaccharide transport system ATP-binding protein
MTAILVDNLSKKFILDKTPNTLKEWLIFRNQKQKKEFWALKNITLHVKRGKSLAIIGRNGSGKSTLLKIISKIIYPTDGSVQVNGKISSLLELGAGFKPDYTGRENVYLNGSILGLSKNEIDKKFDSIVEFSEIGDFVDQPVRNYSSGMYMRLAYSIAVSSNPDILLIDEILAVGDSKFKEKGLQRIIELKQGGTTIILVSHSEDMIKKVCDSVVWLENGKKKIEGNTQEVLKLYNEN